MAQGTRCTQQCADLRYITDRHAYDTGVEASTCLSAQSAACQVTAISED